MFEHITQALALNFYKTKEDDKIFILFTEKFGKIKVRAPGGFKILSRLSPHLDIGSLSEIKIIEKNNLTLVDALLKDTFEKAKENTAFLKNMLAIFNALSKILPEGVPDKNLWEILLEAFLKEKINFKNILSFLGYNTKGKCFLCGKPTSFAFDLKEQNLICEDCSFHFPQDNLLYIDE